MSGQLKSENINMEKAPLEEAIIQQKDPQSPQYIQPNPRKILVPYTRLFYNTRKTLKIIQPKTLFDQQDPHGLRFTLEYNYN
jgi:hypothetical protein